MGSVKTVALSMAALLAGACGKTVGFVDTHYKEITSQRADGLVITVSSETGELRQGQNRFTIAFRSASNNQLVNAGTVTVDASLMEPGASPIVAPIELKSVGTAYFATGSFTSGAWVFRVHWDGPAGQGSTSLDIKIR